MLSRSKRKSLGRLLSCFLALTLLLSLIHIPAKAKQLTVVINPGHSVGFESGTTSCKDITEAQLNERVAIALMKELDSRGYQVYLTHCADPEYQSRALSDPETCCTLRNVGPIVNSVKPDLALSIHHNSTASVPSTVRGMELYWSSYRDFDKEGVYTDWSLWGGEGGYKDTSPCEYAKESYRLAQIIFKQFWNVPNMVPPRSINERDDYLPAHAEAPCILYEGGYLSTPEEAQVMQTESYKNEAANRLANSIDLFFGNSKPVHGINVTPKEVNTTVGSETKLNVVNIPNNNTNDSFTFTSTNPEVATVSQEGIITDIGEGTSQITVKPNNNNLISEIIPVNVYPNAGINVNYDVYTLTGLKSGSNGSLAGSTDVGEPISGIKASLTDSEGNPIDPSRLNITYETQNKEGWNSEVTDNTLSGSEKDNQIKAVKFYLTGTDADNYQLYYRTYIPEFNWTAWITKSFPSGSVNYDYAVAGLELLILPRNTFAPNTEGTSYYDGTGAWNMEYKTHISNIGWGDFTTDEKESGDPTSGEWIEAIELKPNEKLPAGQIISETHITNLGWVDGEENIIGTTGKALWIEALKLWLTGDLGNQYDINYQVYVKGQGWTAPAKNGIIAGTVDQALPVQSVKIWLTHK